MSETRTFTVTAPCGSTVELGYGTNGYKCPHCGNQHWVQVKPGLNARARSLRLRTRLVIAAVGVSLTGTVAVLTAVAGGSSAGSDVQMVGCATDLSGAHASVIVRNSGTSAADYSATVVFRTDGGLWLGSDVVSVAALAPGDVSEPQTANVNGLGDGVRVRCHLTDAHRDAQ